MPLRARQMLIFLYEDKCGEIWCSCKIQNFSVNQVKYTYIHKLLAPKAVINEADVKQPLAGRQGAHHHAGERVVWEHADEMCGQHLHLCVLGDHAAQLIYHRHNAISILENKNKLFLGLPKLEPRRNRDIKHIIDQISITNLIKIDLAGQLY